MRIEVLKVALAGLLHDIGKLAERARFEIDDGYARDNADLYQPYNRVQNRHTHRHALYTAAFIERMAAVFPAQFNRPGWGEGDSLLNLAAGHHRPESPMQWVVATADRLSSGIDRSVYENPDASVPVKDYRKVRMEPLLEKVRLDGTARFEKRSRHRLPLAPVSPEGIFPTDSSPATEAEAEEEYRALFESFVAELSRLAHREDPALWATHFDSLYSRFAGQVPAATVGNVVPDVSLYDHSRATAALASALWLYHEAAGSLAPEAIRGDEVPKFLLVSGDFFGIQDYIFSEGGSTNRAAAKILRGRSFAVSLLSEAAAMLLCRECGVTPLSVLLSAAGKFTVILPNTPSAREGVSRVDERINEWLFARHYGEVGIGFSAVEASPADFLPDRFGELWERLSEALDRRKFGKIPLDRHAGPVPGYLESFDPVLGVCGYCGKRPANRAATEAFREGETIPCCPVCRDHVVMGRELVRTRIVSLFDATEGGDLLAPPFDAFQLRFEAPSRAKGLLASWDIAPWKGERSGEPLYGTRPFGGHVPQFTEAVAAEAPWDRGDRSEAKTRELREMAEPGGAKSFHHIGMHALVKGLDGSYRGVEAIAALKADVDNLGRIFAAGIPGERNLSRTAALSRQVNDFFCLHLPTLLNRDARFRNVYTVFAGGDDLFLVGPWNVTLELAAQLRDDFSRYACGNPGVTLSAAVEAGKPGVPVRHMADRAGLGLEKAKSAGRNRVTAFGETVTWDEFRELRDIGRTMEGWLSDGVANKAMLYRLNALIPMVRQEAAILKHGGFLPLRDTECMKWRARLRYSMVRNVRQGSFSSKEAALEEVLKSSNWLATHGGRFVIALWPVLYNCR